MLKINNNKDFVIVFGSVLAKMKAPLTLNTF